MGTAIFGGTAEPIALAFKRAGMESGFYVYVALGMAVAFLMIFLLPDNRKHSLILED
jgi:MHS family alpha-ketoglutarate permease-like MFS transporter